MAFLTSQGFASLAPFLAPPSGGIVFKALCGLCIEILFKELRRPRLSRHDKLRHASSPYMNCSGNANQKCPFVSTWMESYCMLLQGLLLRLQVL